MLIHLNAPRLWSLVLAGVLLSGTVAAVTAPAATNAARPMPVTGSAL